ncbi:MAG: DUF1905 domain-containing protein [Pseudomonadota bacterium]
MSETIRAKLALARWQGDRGTYHLVIFTGAEAEALETHAVIERLEYGRARGFGSVKVTARIGSTQWRTSVFPQAKRSQWVLLVSKKVMRAEGLAQGDTVDVELSV